MYVESVVSGSSSSLNGTAQEMRRMHVYFELLGARNDGGPLPAAESGPLGLSFPAIVNRSNPRSLVAYTLASLQSLIVRVEAAHQTRQSYKDCLKRS